VDFDIEVFEPQSVVIQSVDNHNGALAIRMDEGQGVEVESEKLEDLASKDGLLAHMCECSVLGLGG